MERNRYNDWTRAVKKEVLEDWRKEYLEDWISYWKEHLKQEKQSLTNINISEEDVINVLEGDTKCQD